MIPPESLQMPTLYVVGDSTARSDAPLRGWGSEIGAFLDPEKINVVNRAIGGRYAVNRMGERFVGLRRQRFVKKRLDFRGRGQIVR